MFFLFSVTPFFLPTGNVGKHNPILPNAYTPRLLAAAVAAVAAVVCSKSWEVRLTASDLHTVRSGRTLCKQDSCPSRDEIDEQLCEIAHCATFARPWSRCLLYLGLGEIHPLGLDVVTELISCCSYLRSVENMTFVFWWFHPRVLKCSGGNQSYLSYRSSSSVRCFSCIVHADALQAVFSSWSHASWSFEVRSWRHGLPCWLAFRFSGFNGLPWWCRFLRPVPDPTGWRTCFFASSNFVSYHSLGTARLSGKSFWYQIYCLSGRPCYRIPSSEMFSGLEEMRIPALKFCVSHRTCYLRGLYISKKQWSKKKYVFATATKRARDSVSCPLRPKCFSVSRHLSQKAFIIANTLWSQITGILALCHKLINLCSTSFTMSITAGG